MRGIGVYPNVKGDPIYLARIPWYHETGNKNRPVIISGYENFREAYAAYDLGKACSMILFTDASAQESKYFFRALFTLNRVFMFLA